MLPRPLPFARARTALALLGSCACLVAGCGDAGPLVTDGGPPDDGGAPLDAAVDAGAALDAGSAFDAGVADGGLLDAGGALDAAAGCSVPSDCPGADGECDTRTCVAATCGRLLAPAGTGLASQVSGDCRRLVCDGSGGTTTVSDDGDLPDDGNACTVDLCAAGSPSTTPAPAGTPCDTGGTGGVCDDAGACVGP